MGERTTVARFDDQVEAALALSNLRGRGIYANLEEDVDGALRLVVNIEHLSRAEAVIAPSPREHPVFRLKSHSLVFVGILAGMAPGLVLGVVLGGGIPSIAVFLGGAVLGSWLGYHLGPDRCSDPRCRAPLAIGVRACSGCHCVVAGRIARPDQHQAAVARYLQSREDEERAAGYRSGARASR